MQISSVSFQSGYAWIYVRPRLKVVWCSSRESWGEPGSDDQYVLVRPLSCSAQPPPAFPSVNTMALSWTPRSYNRLLRQGLPHIPASADQSEGEVWGWWSAHWSYLGPS